MDLAQGPQASLLIAARAIAEGHGAPALGPEIAVARFEIGATRASPKDWFLAPIGHYIYAGDTLLHIAAAAYDCETARALLAAGADVRARNRRGAEPLHYAADGGPDAPSWNPPRQAEMIALLLAAGADPNACDKSGVAPLHRAVRTRCAQAVRALLQGGADRTLQNGNGSTPFDLAQRTTGRGGAGSPTARREQQSIIALLSVDR